MGKNVGIPCRFCSIGKVRIVSITSTKSYAEILDLKKESNPPQFNIKFSEQTESVIDYILECDTCDHRHGWMEPEMEVNEVDDTAVMPKFTNIEFAHHHGYQHFDHERNEDAKKIFVCLECPRRDKHEHIAGYLVTHSGRTTKYIKEEPKELELIRKERNAVTKH